MDKKHQKDLLKYFKSMNQQQKEYSLARIILRMKIYIKM
jgi:hypothetical protein